MLLLASSATASSYAHMVERRHSASVTIRGAGPAPAPAPFAAFGPAPATPLGLCGCARETQCTCGATLGYLQCVVMRCANGCKECSKTPFTKQCGLMSQTCGEDLEFNCTEKESFCSGKFHQARDGLVGLSLQTEHLDDRAYCGPTGKCLGELDIVADIFKPVDGAWLNCAVPKHPNASARDDEEWMTCSAPISGEKGSCTVPMLGSEIPKGEKLEGRCNLLDKRGGKPITKNAWFMIENGHTVPKVKVVTKPCPEPMKAATIPSAVLGQVVASLIVAFVGSM